MANVPKTKRPWRILLHTTMSYSQTNTYIIWGDVKSFWTIESMVHWNILVVPSNRISENASCHVQVEIHAVTLCVYTPDYRLLTVWPDCCMNRKKEMFASHEKARKKDSRYWRESPKHVSVRQEVMFKLGGFLDIDWPHCPPVATNRVPS